MPVRDQSASLLMTEGALPDNVSSERELLLARRATSLARGPCAARLLLNRQEGALVIRRAWTAAWLDEVGRAALRGHLTRVLPQSAEFGTWPSCARGLACPVCPAGNGHAGFRTDTSELAAVSSLAAGLVRHLGTSPPDAGYPARDLAVAAPDVARSAAGRLARALDWLESTVPWWPALRNQTARQVVLFSSSNLFGFTSPLVPQTVFVNARCGVLQLAERLIHEATHGQVYDVLDVARLTDAPPGLLISSPLRTDPRPVLGVLHATVVSARIAVGMRGMHGGPAGAGDPRPVAGRAARSARDGGRELLRRGELTGRGEALIRAALSELDS